MGTEDIILLLGLLIIFSAVLFIAWLTTRLLGRKMAGASKNKLMSVVETLQVGLDRYLYLIKTGDRFFLFYNTRKGMELVSEIKIDEEALAARDEASGSNGFNFRRIFDFIPACPERAKARLQRILSRTGRRRLMDSARPAAFQRAYKSSGN